MNTTFYNAGVKATSAVITHTSASVKATKSAASTTKLATTSFFAGVKFAIAAHKAATK